MEFMPKTWADQPHAPASIASWINRHISWSSASVGRLLGFVPAHDPRIEWGQRYVGEAIDAFWRAAQAVDEIGERHPVPRHARLHRLVGNRLVPGHTRPRPIALLDPRRREPEPTIAL